MVWKAWLTLRSWLSGAKLRPLYDNPETRKLLKPEAQWEVEEGYKLSAYRSSSAASDGSQRLVRVVRQLFERYDYLTLPSASVFPFPVETHWPKEIAGKKMDTYHRWMQVVIPVTMSGCPALDACRSASTPAACRWACRSSAEVSRRAFDPADRQRL